jgi:hypothetical protein
MRKRLATITMLCAAATLLAAAFAAAPAVAAGLPAPDADCAKHLALTRSYPPQELQAALNQMPVYLSEYSDCPNIIRKALDAELGKGLHGGTGDSGGSFLPTWLLVLLIVVVLGGVAFTTAAIRRRGGPGEPPPAT